MDVPLYTIATSFMLTGFLVGGIIVWLNHAQLRRTRKLQKKQIRALEDELEAVNQNLPVVSTTEKIQTALLSKK